MQNNKQLRFFASESGDDNNNEDSSTPSTPTTISGSSQHDTWVQFQRSIVVDGVDTGQTLKERRLGKKNRGGKIDRKRKEREKELEDALKGVDNTQVSTWVEFGVDGS